MNTKNALPATLQEGSALSAEQQTQIIQTYMPANHFPTIRKISKAEDAILAGDTCVGLLSKKLDARKVEALIKLYLVRMNELLDLKCPLSEMAIDEIAATLLVYPYKTLSLTDIALVLQQAIRGVYGEMYESLSVPKVIRWFDAYFEERVAAAERMSERDRSTHNSMLNRFRSSEQADDRGFESFRKSYEIDKMKNRKK